MREIDRLSLTARQLELRDGSICKRRDAATAPATALPRPSLKMAAKIRRRLRTVISVEVKLSPPPSKFGTRFMQHARCNNQIIVLSWAKETAPFFQRGRISVGSSGFVLEVRDAGKPWLVRHRVTHKECRCNGLPSTKTFSAANRNLASPKKGCRFFCSS